MDEKKGKTPLDHVNIAELNHGKASQILKNIAEEDKTAIIQKSGKPLVVVISYEKYLRLFENGIDVNNF
jgi:prevent-host-death family protein